MDEDAVGIVFGFRKFYRYIYGAEIILKTDHEHLKFIFGNNKLLSSMIQTRLLRWDYFLSSFRYEIEIVKSKANGNYDALSRLPIEDDKPVFEREYTSVYYVQSVFRTIDLKCVARETAADKSLRKIMMFVQQGWPKNNENLTEVEKNLCKNRFELSIEGRCLFWGFRVVIPGNLQKDLLSELHASHMGAVKMKQLARSYFWWLNLNCYIEKICGKCKICLESQVTPPPQNLTYSAVMAKQAMEPGAY